MPNTETKVITVSELNRTIKQLIGEKKEFKNFWIKGEISNYSASGTGHIYFNLKDNASVIRCAFFYYSNQNYKGKKLKDGLEVLVFGNLSVYEPGGYYSITVNKVEEVGRGDIHYQLELLKKKLEEEGLFDQSRKRPLPKFPKTLGIATAMNGAAVEDIIRIAKERYPNINILIAPCLVQGEMAVNSIINAIKELNNPKWEVDVIIAGRGGGSFEDLLAFCDEKVVRAFYESNVPIVSAVGHQTDSVLSDFAADDCFPTPTAAAEFVVPDLEDSLSYLDEMEERFKQALKFKMENAREKFRLISGKNVFKDPALLLQDRFRRLDDILEKISILGKNYLQRKASGLQKFDSLKLLLLQNVEKHKKRYEILTQRIDNFSPLATLKRGYSVVRNEKREVISSVDKVKKGQHLEAILNKGRLKLEVLEIYE